MTTRGTGQTQFTDMNHVLIRMTQISSDWVSCPLLNPPCFPPNIETKWSYSGPGCSWLPLQGFG